MNYNIFLLQRLIECFFFKILKRVNKWFSFQQQRINLSCILMSMQLICFDTLYLISCFFFNLNVEKEMTAPKPYNSDNHRFIFSLIEIFL